MKLAWLAVLLLLVPGTLSAATPARGLFHAAPVEEGPAPAGTVSGGAEPMVLVHGSTILVGDTAGIHRSTNGGATWTRNDIPNLPGLFTDGRGLAVDAAGRIYAVETQGQFLSVASSTNGGATWTNANQAVAVAPIADRPWIAARNAGEIAVVYYNPGRGEECAYSTDGGATWLTRSLIGTGPSNAGNLVFDKQGRLWYAEDLYFVRWDAPCSGFVKQSYLGGGGAQIFNQVAVTDAGEAFSAVPETGNGKMLLVGIPGIPGTRKALAVSPPTLRSNTFGAIAAKADGSEIAVAWYGSATAGNPAGSFSGSWDVYLARVTGFWTASPSVTVTKVTSTPNHVGGFCMDGVSCTGDRDLLDYFGIAYDAAGAVHIAYGHDGATSTSEVRHAKVP